MMTLRRFFPCAAWLFLLWPVSLIAEPVTPEGQRLQTSSTPVRIAEGGRALVPIVLSPDSSEELRKTAAHLAETLKRITGAEFSIEESREAAGITLGTLEQFPDDSLKGPLTIRKVYDGVEAFVIRSNDGKIRLLANTDLGVSHAAARFLELIGYRYYFMSPAWEIFPDIKTLAFDLNEDSRPVVWSRRLGFTRMNIKSEDGDPDRKEAYRRWQAANRVAESLSISTNHIWHAIPDAFKMNGQPFKKEFADHPEYFALVDGKRTPPQFCVTNTGLQDVVTRYARMYFEVNPHADMVSLDTADQANWCTCPECEKLGNPSNQAFYLANVVAKVLAKSNPGKYVGILAYSWHSDPPDFDLEPNVFVMLTAGMNASKLSFDELFDAWTRKCQSLGIYEYYSYWEMDKGMLPGKGPHNAIDDLPARYKRYADHHVIAFIAEASNSWGTHGLGYYMASRVLWNPDDSVESLKTDFYEKAFGPAAPAMARYYGRLDLSHRPFRGVAQLRQCLKDLREAGQLAKSRPDVLARLEDLKTHLIYTYLGNKVEQAKGDAEKEAALEWFKWAYRIRNNYMIDWVTFRAALGNHEYSRTLAAKFNEPSWNYRRSKDNPWRDDRPVTTKEIEERLDAIEAEWGQAPEVKLETFSDDYVLVDLSTEATSTADKPLGFIGTANFLLASPKGESLKFTVQSAPSPRIERQDAKFTLSTLDGKTLASGDLPEGESEMDLMVPGPGIYKFSFKRGGRGWSIDLKDVPGALVIDRDTEHRPQFITTYFYVPKGTREFVVYAQEGGVDFKTADGERVYQGSPFGDFVSVTVPDGADGQVWSLTGKTRNVWFANIPTILAVTPSRIFLPREVATKDGLSPVEM